MSGYTKLFSTIITSSIWSEDDKTRLMWVTILASADARGYVSGSVPGMAAIARMSVEDARHSIEVLCAPDPDSRTKDHEGRRLLPCDGGWLIVNYAKYREQRDPETRAQQNREAQQRYRNRHRKPEVSRKKPKQKHIPPYPPKGGLCCRTREKERSMSGMQKTAPTSTRSSPTSNTLPALPESQAAEAAVLGSMILDPSVIADVLEVLPSDGFFAHQDHRVVWRLILSLNERNDGKGVDGLLLRNEIEACPELGPEGVQYLERILQAVPTSQNAVYYARIVRDKAARRNLIDAGREIISLADEQDDISTLADRAQTTLAKACESANYQEQAIDCLSALQAAFNDLERETRPKLATTYIDIAALVPGFMPGQMIVIAGRPRQGKTALALSIVIRNFMQPQDGGPRVLFISFEMTAQDLMQRALSFVSGVPFASMSCRTLEKADWTRITQAMTVIQSWDLLLADRLAPLPSSVRNTARKLHRRKPLDAVVVDYVQRMRCAEKRATRDWEMSTISNELKNLALELQIPIIVLAQLNRECDRREDHRPRISDLRDSGTLEQDADVILTVYRADCYEREPDRHTHVAEIAVAKHRNGPEGVANLVFIEPTMAFQNQARLSDSDVEEYQHA